MAYTVLIEQPAKNIKLADGIVLTVLNCRIMVRLWGCIFPSRRTSAQASSHGSQSLDS